MAEAINIPSPTAFLRKTPDPPAGQSASKEPEKKRKKKNNASPRRPSTLGTETKTKKAGVNAMRKSSVMSGAVGGHTGGDGGVQKPKQSKSRNGCATCKSKRLKCDEQKPVCQQCMRRNVECGGYKKEYKWRTFEETNVKINVERQKQVTPPDQSDPVMTSVESSKSTTPTSATPPPVTLNRSINKEQNASKKKKDSFAELQIGRIEGAARRTSSDHGPHQRVLPSRQSPVSMSSRETIRAYEDLPVVVDEEPSAQTISSSATSSDHPQVQFHSYMTPGLGLSPTLTEMLLPFDGGNPAHHDFISFELPENFQGVPSPSHPVDDVLADDGAIEDDLEEVQLHNVQGRDLPTALVSRNPRSPLSRQSTPFHPRPSRPHPSRPPDAFRRPISYIYPQPYFSEDSAEMLTFRFDRLTCGILSIMDGPNENPWRQLVWPLAQQSPALYHAITAMTAFHSAGDVPGLRVVGHEHKAASIKFIQEGITHNSMTRQTAIATALALGFSESWDQHTSTGNSHIKGAQVLVKQAVQEHQRQPLEGLDLARLKFLCNAWVYMDVIARLTSVDSDESNDFDNTFLFSNEPVPMIMGDLDGQPGFGIDFGMPIDARLDPLMGCAGTLFPLVGRVANLVRKVCRSQTNSPSTISQANELKMALEGWDPPYFIERPEDPTTDVEHTLQTAEAYRWATLLHLHQSVPELPSMRAPELAQRVLQYLATVPLASRTVIVQIYPLMVAGCEAKADDRDWVRARWAAMHARMRIGSIEKCATVTEEVWRRRDTYEAQPTSNRRLVATSELHPIRTRGRPLVRSPTGGLSGGDPGHTGVVFSYVEADDDGLPPLRENENPRARERRNGRDPRMHVTDPAYTVRGHLHWVGVMWDWGWEILLG